VKSVECLYPKLNPTPKTGIMIKVPLGPPIKVNQTLIKKPVHEVIFIFPEAERPYMLIFNEQKNDPMFYYFSQDSAVFLKQMGIPQ
jgi:hypothetical protein